MKSKFTRQNRMWYVLGLLVSLFLVFIRRNGINGVKLGMDLAGGVRLTYRIDYTKYNDQYTNANELAAAKKNARDIITQQIDSRISQLGVANYEAYSQLIDGKEYMIVELGGVSDIDAAKAVIGKTVELEFGLENEKKSSPDTDKARKQFADDLLNRVRTDKTTSMEQLGKLNGSNGVKYGVYTGELTLLPTIYQKQPILANLKDGQLVDTVAHGTFFDVPKERETQGYKDQKGYVITRLVNKKKTQRTTYDIMTFRASAPDAKIATVKTQAQTGVATYTDGKLIYPAGPVLAGLSGVNVTIYEADGKPATKDFLALTKKETTKKAYEGWLSMDKLPQAIPGYTYDAKKERTAIPSGSGQKIVHVTQTKTADQSLFAQYEYKVEKKKADEILASLKSPELYRIEALFIPDEQPRKTATDPVSGKILNGGFFEYAAVGTTQLGQPSVNITFNEKGKHIFCNITAANIKKQMAIFIGGELKTNPVIQDKICGGQTQISGSFTKEAAQKLAKDLNEGALPAPLILAQEETVAPVLGMMALEHILRAGLVGLVLITVYMAIIYGPKWAGISLVILLMFLLFSLALLKMLGAVLGLSGLAAIVLSIGMGVDATILVFERIIENHKAGQSRNDSVIDASKQAWSAVRDGQLSTGMIALLLMFMGVNIFKGFGTMMALNIFVIVVLIYPLIKILSLHFIAKKK